VRAFTVVTAVPSADAERNARHPLPDVVGGLVGHTRDRYERLLDPSGIALGARATDPRRYVATRRLESENVLLIDDTWTTGAKAESAAAVLKAAGAGVVGIVVSAATSTRSTPTTQRGSGRCRGSRGIDAPSVPADCDAPRPGPCVQERGPDPWSRDIEVVRLELPIDPGWKKGRIRVTTPSRISPATA
jgi:hypothetical protein